MNLTPHHAKFFAHELTRRCPSDSIEKLAGALVNAQVVANCMVGREIHHTARDELEIGVPAAGVGDLILFSFLAQPALAPVGAA